MSVLQFTSILVPYSEIASAVECLKRALLRVIDPRSGRTNEYEIGILILVCTGNSHVERQVDSLPYLSRCRNNANLIKKVRSSKSKDRRSNGQMTNNSLQNITQKTRVPLETGADVLCSGRVNSSCSTCVISHLLPFTDMRLCGRSEEIILRVTCE